MLAAHATWLRMGCKVTLWRLAKKAHVDNHTHGRVDVRFNSGIWPSCKCLVPLRSSRQVGESVTAVASQ